VAWNLSYCGGRFRNDHQYDVNHYDEYDYDDCRRDNDDGRIHDHDGPDDDDELAGRPGLLAAPEFR
jgi:hypothetical protein